MVSGTRDNPSPEVPLAEVTFSPFLSKIQSAVYIRRQTRLVGRGNPGGRVVSPRQVGNPSKRDTFLHINALAHLTGTTLGMASVT